MKKQLFFVLELCFAISAQKLTAQDTESKIKFFKDTVIITPDVHSKVMLIGSETEDDYGLEYLSKYKRLDTLKNLLIADVEKARKEANYPAVSKTTHYFVSENGKRRLKAEGEDYLEPEVNVKKEEASMELGLPVYEYIIHDRTSSFEYYIYVDDPARLSDLANVNLNDALVLLAHNNKVRNKYYRIEYKKADDRWILSDSLGGKHFGRFLGIICVGGTLLGSELSPFANFNYGYEFKDKYNRPVFGITGGFSGYIFTEVQNKELSSVYAITSYDFRLLGNFTNTLNPFWVGLEGGGIYTANSGWLSRAIRFGTCAMSSGKLSFSLDALFYRYNNHLDFEHATYEISVFLPIGN